MRVVTHSDGQGIFEEIQGIQELRMVEKDTTEVCDFLPLPDIVWGGKSGIRVMGSVVSWVDAERRFDELSE